MENVPQNQIQKFCEYKVCIGVVFLPPLSSNGGKGGILSILASLWVWEEILLPKKERKKERKERKKERKKEEKEERKNKLFNNKEFFNFAHNFLIFAINHIAGN
jgi:hypothetical protein